jgi:hypothetical protein
MTCFSPISYALHTARTDAFGVKVGAGAFNQYDARRVVRRL